MCVTQKTLKMNLIFVILFNLLLFNSCLMVRINRESHDEFQQPNNNENCTKVNQLNGDFEYAIFEKSDLFEMLQFTKDPRYSDFVKKPIFPVKYHNHMINIFTNTDDDHPDGRVHEGTREIVCH